MARTSTIKHTGRTFKIVVENGVGYIFNSANLCTAIGTVQSRPCDDVASGVVWTCNGRRLHATKELAAKRIIQINDDRSMFKTVDGWDTNRAHFEAILIESERKRIAMVNLIREALVEDRERTAEKIRATEPMLTVVAQRDDGSCTVSIWRERSVDVYVSTWDNPGVAGVNWSAYGTSTPEQAREYAAAILRAADEADAISMCWEAVEAKAVKS